MKARKKFPIMAKCKHCKGSGYVQKKRTGIPCKECGHDVHFEHRIEEGWTYDKEYGGYDSYAQCSVDKCKCSIKIPHPSHPGREFWDWPHP
jgi:hypothetical protein